MMNEKREAIIKENMEILSNVNIRESCLKRRIVFIDEVKMGNIPAIKKTIIKILQAKSRMEELYPYFPWNVMEYIDIHDRQLVKRCEENRYELLKYIHIDGLPVFSFQQIDEHLKLDNQGGNDATVLQEMDALVYFLLKRNEASGNSYIKAADLIRKMHHMLDKCGHSSMEDLTAYLKYLSKNGHITYRNGIVAFPFTENREHHIKSYFNNAIAHPEINSQQLSAFVPIDDLGILDEEQLKCASDMVKKAGVSLMTGGPGTGKSSVIRAIIRGIQDKYPDKNMVILSPTGKAAARIKEITQGIDINVSTIHKFVGYMNPIAKNRAKQIVKDTDIIIIDEASMVDMEILEELILMVAWYDVKFIVVGDEDQLSAVGTGNLINDLKAMGVYHKKLTKNYRSNGSIVSNARCIINGDTNITEDDSFKIMETTDYKVSEKNIVLSPYKKTGLAGSSIDINKAIQEKRFGTSYQLGNRFFIGDKVILTRNNYKAGYYNGDTGIITGYDGYHDGYVVKIDGSDAIVSVTDDNDIELGYAITVHKSQGSEFNEVDICIPEYSPFITREFLYTAVTRAKNKVRLWTTREIFDKIVTSETEERRSFITFESSLKAA